MAMWGGWKNRGRQEVFWLQSQRPKTELIERGDYLERVISIQPKPDVRILGVARVAVQGHCITAHDQVADAVIV